ESSLETSSEPEPREWSSSLSFGSNGASYVLESGSSLSSSECKGILTPPATPPPNNKLESDILMLSVEAVAK
ncbi:hypothetical protein WICMUC_003795, partial [Wickerhamomyces mucosus]